LLVQRSALRCTSVKRVHCPLSGYIALSVTIRRQVFTFTDSIRSYSVD
jgi:hypothetical protein